MVLNGHHTPRPSPPSPRTPPPTPLISPKDSGSSLYSRARAYSALHVLPGGLSDGAAPACGFYRRDDARTPEQGDAVAAATYLTYRYVGRADVLVALEEGAHEVGALALEEGAPATAQAWRLSLIHI